MKQVLVTFVCIIGYFAAYSQCEPESLCTDISESGQLTESESASVDCYNAQNTSYFLLTTSNNENNSGDLFVSFENVVFPDTLGEQVLQVALVEISPVATDPCIELFWLNTIVCTTIDSETTLAVPETSLTPGTTYIVLIGNNDLAPINSPTFDIGVSGQWVNIDACCDVEIVQGTQAFVTAEGSTTPITWSSNTEYPLEESGNQVSLYPLETTVVTAEGEINGCPLVYNITITVTPPITPFNLFTPNGDGTNEVFEIANIEKYQNSIITIYSRWGQKVFNSIGYTKKWDGTNNGKKLPAGTYYYVIELNSLEVDIPPITGYTTILY